MMCPSYSSSLERSSSHHVGRAGRPVEPPIVHETNKVFVNVWPSHFTSMVPINWLSPEVRPHNLILVFVTLFGIHLRYWTWLPECRAASNLRDHHTGALPNPFYRGRRHHTLVPQLLRKPHLHVSVYFVPSLLVQKHFVADFSRHSNETS